MNDTENEGKNLDLEKNTLNYINIEDELPPYEEVFVVYEANNYYLLFRDSTNKNGEHYFYINNGEEIDFDIKK